MVFSTAMVIGHRRRGTALAVLVCSAVLAGCGGSGDSSSQTASTPQVTSAGPPGRPHLEKLGDFDQPVWITQPPGASDLYVVERSGRVRIVRDGNVVDPP